MRAILFERKMSTAGDAFQKKLKVNDYRFFGTFCMQTDRPYAMGRTQLIFSIRSGNIRFLEMGWRGKRDFTVLNNCVLRKHNGLIIR